MYHLRIFFLLQHSKEKCSYKIIFNVLGLIFLFFLFVDLNIEKNLIIYKIIQGMEDL